MAKKKSRKKWIQGAKKSIKKRGTEGSFRKWCASRSLLEGGKVGSKCINAGLDAKDPGIRAKARLAKAFARARAKRSGK